MLQPADNGERYELLSPTVMPRAAGFLWNPRMMIQVTCRGYAVAQFMQPEPAKYAYAPNLEAKTFMQPEQPYYAHHPGRFFYIKDEDTGQIFSAPYEPVRASLDHFRFSVGKSDIRWFVEKDGISLDITLGLSAHDVVELWEVQVRNASGRPRRLSLYSYFPVGYMSWMNQSAQYRQDLGGIVASCVTPYQKVADYFKNRNFKDKTFFLADKTPTAWEAKQETFEGEGGLHNPSGLKQAELSKGDALYETPAAILQYRLQMAPGQSCRYRFIFGPAFDDAEIIAMRDRYLSDEGFSRAAQEYAAYIAGGKGCLKIQTPDPELDNFVNHWLPRQMFYHGDVNRLTTDPQTRNYLQDNMGMTWIRPQVTRAAFLHALAQQEASGAMPDGILLVEGAELKYINQIPHTDHCVWLPVCLRAYLDETNDYALLHEPVRDHAGQVLTVFQRISNAMRWLLKSRDHRGLSYIAQGDWCDPMNMVGFKGKGVSGWLSVATAYALNLWAEVCTIENDAPSAEEFKRGASAINDAVNTHLWDGHWFARGITDDGVVFGTSKEKEGRIFLNAQGWSLLSGAAMGDKRDKVITAVQEHLETPYGTMTLAPAYTAMRDDVGRVTQKFPGSAENGSVYNHDAVFYIFSLYTLATPPRKAPDQLPVLRSLGEGGSTSSHAFSLLRRMLPGPDMADYQQRGLLPVFIPNYYRGAWHQHPRTAGRSSQLFNTGTVSWFYRCLVEGLFGLKGDRHGLLIQPQLPAHWHQASVTREFRGATFHVEMRRTHGISAPQITVDGTPVAENRVSNIRAGQIYKVQITLPAASQSL